MFLHVSSNIIQVLELLAAHIAYKHIGAVHSALVVIKVFYFSKHIITPRKVARKWAKGSEVGQVLKSVHLEVSGRGEGLLAKMVVAFDYT